MNEHLDNPPAELLIALMIRSFDEGKTRLASDLDPDHRRRLGIYLANRSLAAASRHAACVVVTGDSLVADWASSAGVLSLPDPGLGLDRAATAAMEHAAADGRPWLIIHSDLPLIDPESVALLVQAVEEGPVLAPSYNGGTNAYGAQHPQTFSYGRGSFRRHLAAAPTAKVVVDRRLAIDIDTIRDFRAVSRLANSEWVGAMMQVGDRRV